GLNGEGLALHGAPRIQQVSPQDRKHSTTVPADTRHDDPQPSPDRTRSHHLPPGINQEVLCNPAKLKEANEVASVDGCIDGSSDSRRVQSGSESEGDQKTRHRRKQEQPRRQSVIYPITAQPEGAAGGGGDSSSDDSQGFDVLLTRNTVERRDSPHDSLRSNSPADPALRLPIPREAFSNQGMSQAMSHALAHPFLAAHLNANQLLQMTHTPPSGKVDVPPQPLQQLQVRTDLLEPHPKEPETYPIQEPQRSLTQLQITQQEVDINSIRTNNAPVEGTTAPVKKRRCSPRYLENDTASVGDASGTSTISEVGRSDGVENIASIGVSLSAEESATHTLSASIDSNPINGVRAASEDEVKSVSGSSSNNLLLNVSAENCEVDNSVHKTLGKNDQEYFNGDNEIFDNVRKNNRKRKSESESVTEMEYQCDGPLEECGDTKRRTRQKRAVSYVEDGTDPVLEMNEDSSPDATPLKKKGRRSKDIRDKVDGESNPSPEQQTPIEPPITPPILTTDDSQSKSSSNSPMVGRRGRGVLRGVSRGRGRQLVPLSQDFASVTEPLHVDTTLITEPDLRVPGPPPITPSSCSPDVYDFNDTDSDGVGRGKKGKRGRKKGSGLKKNARSPLEIAKSSISPRPREPHAKSPRSPKFFSSSRSPMSERNKEWLRGISPPVKDLSKTLAEMSSSESTTVSLLQESSVDIGKIIPLSVDILTQDSQSGDAPPVDNAAKTDAHVVSPRRSSRRNKTRDNQELLTAKGNESTDSNLRSSPSGNLKNNTSFSGLILDGAQNRDDKDEKALALAATLSQPVNGLGSPSSRIRKRGRRSGDQLLPDQQTNTDETQTLLMQENGKKPPLDRLAHPEESPSKCDISLKVDCVNKITKTPDIVLECVLDSGAAEIRCPPTKPAGSKNRAKGRGKGKKKKPGKSPKVKCTQMKDEVSQEPTVLPHTTEHYDTVPEDAHQENTHCSGTTVEGESSYFKDRALIQESSTSEPSSPVRDVAKHDGNQRKSRTKRSADYHLVQSNLTAADDIPDAPDLSCQNSIGENTTVIGQTEELESRGRRLRTRRTSAKQDAKSESHDVKTEINDGKSESQERKVEALDRKSGAQEEKFEAQNGKFEGQDGIPEVRDSSSEVQDGSSEAHDRKAENHENQAEVQDLKIEIETQDKKPESHEEKSETEAKKSETREKKSKIQAEKCEIQALKSEIPTLKFETQNTPSEDQVVNNEAKGTDSDAKGADKEGKNTNNEGKGADNEASDTKSDIPSGKCETQTSKSEIQDTIVSIEDTKAESGNAGLETPIVQTKVPDVLSEPIERKSKPTSLPTQASDDLEVLCTFNSLEVSAVTEPSINLNTLESSSMAAPPPDALAAPPPDALEVPQGTDVDVDAETVENIAKFLEETASNIPAATEESYIEKRPKRSSRPPRKMDENEMNDLLMLLNMEDEESEDEDYVPKDLDNFDSMAESDEGGDSDGNDYREDDGDSSGCESRGSGSLGNLLSMASDSGGCNDFVPTTLKHGKGPAKQKGLKKDRGKKGKTDTSSAKKGKVIKGKVKSCSKSRNDDSELRKKNEDGRRKGETYERRGPFIRLDKTRSREVIVNAPHRDEDEQEKTVRKTSIQFYCKIEAKQKTAKVGYNSTLHNNYDAFSKDTSWYCSLCKNYSHSCKLGDLYGPYFIEGLTLLKKQYPQVLEGQVVESSSPTEVGKLKRRTQRRESVSDGSLETRKGRPATKEAPQQLPDHPNSAASANTKEASREDVVTPPAAPSVARPPGTECWVHEACLLWAPGVHINNSKLCGLEESVIHAQDSICSNCSEAGATVACLGKGCSLMVHVPCATQLQWTLDHHSFKSLCPKHTKLT
ncbi:hypothetical protein OTU49_012445, partial [Cherax quadricarinatus]